MSKPSAAKTPADVVAANDQRLCEYIETKVADLNRAIRQAFTNGLRAEIKLEKVSPLVGGYKVITIDLVRPVKRERDDD